MNHVTSGSYNSDDVLFLLKTIDMPVVGIEEKERLIQSGQRHYSEMISRETPPSSGYLQLFHEACNLNNSRFCADLIRMARRLAEVYGNEITLLSLVRAGTPIGVLLKRILEQYFLVKTHHYSISIIRDRGIDQNALRHVLMADKRSPDTLVFIDGWTGKGVISSELSFWVDKFNKTEGCLLSSDLHVVADISGTAAYSATHDDYLIPSAIMNSIVSGLVSRSILNSDYIGIDDFHGCLYYREFESIDRSRYFVDDVMKFVPCLLDDVLSEKPFVTTPEDKERLRQKSFDFLEKSRELYGIRDINQIKPGIGEATRVLLRRVPYLLVLRDENIPEVAHLRLLAAEKGVPLEINSSLPYNAAAFIATVAS